jgi:hypothetical protein
MDGFRANGGQDTSRALDEGDAVFFAYFTFLGNIFSVYLRNKRRRK